MKQDQALAFVEEITIAGRTVRLRHVELSIGDVHLNPMNQRVQFLISLLGHTPSEDEIAEQLWALSDVKQLYRSVKQNGGLLERIIVCSDGAIIEGNCRTVVYRKLYHNEGDERWANIPARVLPEDINDKEIAYLLGELHVAGKNEWTAFEQAAYIYRMNNEFGYTVADLAELLRMGKAKVNQRLWAYVLMNDRFLSDSRNPTDILKYSYFEEFYKAFRTKDAATPWEGRFPGWVKDGKLDHGAQVRNLPQIVNDPEVLKALEDSGYEDAILMLSRERPELTSRLFRLIDRTIEELAEAPAGEIRALKSGDRARLKKLQDLHKALKEFVDLAGVSLS